MTHTYGNNKSLLIGLLIALILHMLLSLVLFLKFETEKNHQEKTEELTEKLKKLLKYKQEVSTLKPSPYSAPVVYYDEDKFKESHESEDAQKNKEKPTEIKKQPEKQEKNIKEKAKDLGKKSQELKKKIEESIQVKQSDRPVIVKEKPQKQIKQEIEPEPQKVQESQREKKVPLSQMYSLQKRLKNRQKASQAVPKLAALTQGFVNYMKEEGNNQFLQRQGNSDKIDPHEAKLLSYYNKIIAFFHRAARSFYGDFNRIIQQYVQLQPGAIRIEVSLKLIINKDGTLFDIITMQNSGFDLYDKQIIKTFENAAPFPPVPNHLSKDELIFPITIYTPLERPGFALRIG